MKKYLNLRSADNKGFTLVELIIVIGIMSLLVAIIVPDFLQYLDKARKVRDMEMARVLGTALERCIAVDPNVCGEWEIIDEKGKGGQSHVEYTVTDHTGKTYTITNVFEFTLTRKGDITNKAYEKNYRDGVLRNARKQVTQKGQDILWDEYVDELATTEITIMYRKYSIGQFKVAKSLENGRVEVWVCPIAPGSDGEGKGNGWVYYRLYPDADPRYMSNQPPVGTNANGGGKGGTTF